MKPSSDTEKNVLVSQKNFWIFLALLWASVFLAYSNSFNIAFQFDDTHTVQSNLAVRSLKNIPLYFVDANTSSYRPENSGYRPMTTTGLALGFALSGLDTWGYHLIKIIEHCISATLIFLIALLLTPRFLNTFSGKEAFGISLFFWISWFSGLLFGVHRANTETVNYICAISSLQAGMFYIAAFYLYVRTRVYKKQISESRKVISILLSVVFYTFGNMSKEEAITLPAMIFFYEWFFELNSVGIQENIREKILKNLGFFIKTLSPYIIAAGIYLYLRVFVPEAIADTSRGNVPTFIYFITQFRSWLYYWQLFFWPFPMNADNLGFGFSTTFFDFRVLSALAFHIAVWVLAYHFRKKRPLYAFAVLWMYITITPASSIFRLVEAVNDHRMYIPYMFLSFLVVALVFEGVQKLALYYKSAEKSAYPKAVLFLFFCSVALGVSAFERNEVWLTDISLWEDVLDKNPESVRAMNVLGISLLNRGEIDRPTDLLERCHKISPAYLPCIVHLSIAYASKKKFDLGLKLLLYGLSVDPNYVHLNFHAGLYYKDYFADFEKSKIYLTRARDVSKGRFFQATLKLADILLEEKNITQGMTFVAEVLQTDPSNGEAWEIYAKGHYLRGDKASFKQIMDRLMGVVPDNHRYHLLMANYYERENNMDLALQYFDNAAHLMPNSVQAWQGLVRIQTRLHHEKEASDAGAKIKELIERKTWFFSPSLFLVGEKPRQTGP